MSMQLFPSTKIMYREGEIRRRVRMVYTHASFAENFKAYLLSDSFEFSDDQRQGVLRRIKCQEAKLSGLPEPAPSSSDESEFAEEPQVHNKESTAPTRNTRRKLFANHVKEHIADKFPLLESHMLNKLPNYSIKEDARALAYAAGVSVSLMKMWGIY
ncbi:uncharacterized protein LOC135844197 [Planococcus citri]|uniref:uncharacterized protein LOC135844197 n=1 Tax=Planococcus citri TaxID=170843 RepID=UPI0031F9E217